MAEYQRHPLASPYDVGQDFWAVNYAGPSLMDRKRYIDPRTGQVWESLEEALRFYRSSGYQQWDEGIPDDPNVEAAMPDIRSVIPPGPPGEAAFRASQAVPSVLPERRITAPPVVSALPPSNGVPVQRDDLSNWRVNQEHELRKALEREETEPQLQGIDTSMLSRLISSAQASDLVPLPRPPTREELVDRGLALQELLKLEEAPTVPTQLEKPRTFRAGTPSDHIQLPGGKIVDGKLILDESPEAWKEFMRREPREVEPSLLKEKELKEKDELGLLGVMKDVMKDVLLSTISESKAHATVRTPSFSSEVHDLYAALSDAEHRSDDHRQDRWIYADGPGVKTSKPWGPVQMKPSTLEEAKRVGSLSNGIPLTAEEESYVNSFLQGNRYVGKKDKELYISIAKKLLHYYSNKYKDPLRIASVWRWGERGAAPKSKSFGKGKYGLGKDISSPVGNPGSDLAYWKEFKRMMGL